MAARRSGRRGHGAESEQRDPGEARLSEEQTSAGAADAVLQWVSFRARAAIRPVWLPIGVVGGRESRVTCDRRVRRRPEPRGLAPSDDRRPAGAATSQSQLDLHCVDTMTGSALGSLELAVERSNPAGGRQPSRALRSRLPRIASIPTSGERGTPSARDPDAGNEQERPRRSRTRSVISVSLAVTPDRSSRDCDRSCRGSWRSSPSNAWPPLSRASSADRPRVGGTWNDLHQTPEPAVMMPVGASRARRRRCGRPPPSRARPRRRGDACRGSGRRRIRARSRPAGSARVCGARPPRRASRRGVSTAASTPVAERCARLRGSGRRARCRSRRESVVGASMTSTLSLNVTRPTLSFLGSSSTRSRIAMMAA